MAWLYRSSDRVKQFNISFPSKALHAISASKIVNNSLTTRLHSGCKIHDSSTPYGRTLVTGDYHITINLKHSTNLVAHLMSASRQQLVSVRFNSTYEDIRTQSGKRFDVDADDETRKSKLIEAYDSVSLPHTNGHLGDDLRHLRHLDWEKHLVEMKYMLAVLGQESFLKLCKRHITAHIHESKYVDHVIYFAKLLGSKRFRRFINNSVVSRLGDPEFVKAVNHWYEKLGPEAFVTFMSSGSVASRLQDAAFIEAVNYWYEKLGPEAFVTFMGNNCVASRLKDPTFNRRLDSWYEALGTERFAILVHTCGIAARLHVLDDVLPFLSRNTNGTPKMSKELCKTVSYRQKEPVSESVAKAIYDKLKKKKRKLQGGLI